MPIKYIDAGELADSGLLQEVNRRFFHPLGLALVVAADTDEDGNRVGPWEVKGVWDARDDPEGVIFGEDLSREKAEKVQELVNARYDQRIEKLGYWVQPLPDPE